LDKTHYVKILFPNGKVYKYNIYDDYDTKIKTIEKVYSIWGDYFEENWDKTLIIAGTPQRPVSRILDQLAYYLLSEDRSKVLTEQNILNEYKNKKIKDNELPVSSVGDSVEELLYASDSDLDYSDYRKANILSEEEYLKSEKPYDKRYNRFKHLQKIDLNFVEHVYFTTLNHYNSLSKKTSCVFLMYIDSTTCMFISRKYYDLNKGISDYQDQVLKELLHNYYSIKRNFEITTKNLQDMNKVLGYAKKAYMNLLTRFQLIEIFKEYNLDPALPYSAEWKVINEDGEFEYQGQSYKVKDYDGDCILVYEQGEKKWFFDEGIKKIKVEG
jgi:hypothetical protein